MISKKKFLQPSYFLGLEYCFLQHNRILFPIIFPIHALLVPADTHLHSYKSFFFFFLFPKSPKYFQIFSKFRLCNIAFLTRALWPALSYVSDFSDHLYCVCIVPYLKIETCELGSMRNLIFVMLLVYVMLSKFTN